MVIVIIVSHEGLVLGIPQIQGNVSHYKNSIICAQPTCFSHILSFLGYSKIFNINVILIIVVLF